MDLNTYEDFARSLIGIMTKCTELAVELLEMPETMSDPVPPYQVEAFVSEMRLRLDHIERRHCGKPEP